MKKPAVAVVLAAFAAASLSAIASAGASVPVVEGGAARVCIVLPEGAPKCCSVAAAEFAKWTKELTGADIPVGASAVRGLAPMTLRLDPSDARVKYDGFRLTASADGISVVAKEPFGIVYSVYWVLNRFGRIWWCEPESGADFAKTDSFSIPVFGQIAANPCTQKAYLVFGFTLQP